MKKIFSSIKFIYLILLFLFLVFYSFLSWASCQKSVSNLLKNLHSDGMHGLPHQSSCKVWPYSPDKMLLVMTFVSELPGQDLDNPTYDIDVAVVDRYSGQIISHLHEAKAFSDDAIYTDDITIDTAPYQLNSSIRAFGIRFHQRNISVANRFFGEVINLYYLQNGSLRLAFKGLSMNESYEEIDSYCVGETTNIRRFLVVEKEQHNGFNNLKINEISTRSKSKLVKPEECEEVIENIKKNSVILKYNGNQYLVPKEYHVYNF